MSVNREELDNLTRKVLTVLRNNLIFTKVVNLDYESRLGDPGKPFKPAPRRKLIWWAVQRYFANLRGAWIDAIKALAGVNPHRHCDED